MMKRLKVSRNATRLEKRVARIVNGYVEPDYSLESYLKNLMQDGCSSGMVRELIYYHDTKAFYKLYRDEINSMVSEMTRDYGCEIGQLINGWDKDDPFACEDNNQNILAWVGFEETACRLASENGIDL